MLRDGDTRRDAPPELAERVAAALGGGELGIGDLTARQIGSFLGKTSSLLYRRFGSLDGFLHEVAQAGFRALVRRLEAAAGRGEIADLAAAFVAFGLESPALYYVMFEHRYDWEELRHAGALSDEAAGLAIWRRVVDELSRAGSAAPATDARLLYAGLHGLVSLASGGRANVGEMATSDRDIALASARALARKICPRATE